jgi:glycosyltransferase involved in cell wall biosynthesis
VINRHSIDPSPLASLPAVRRYYRGLLPLFPSIIDRLRIPSDADLVISTSHCAAHGVNVPRGIPHLTYCFSPMRYLYDQRKAYARGGAPLAARVLDLLAPRLKAWDRRAARRCDEYWAISDYVAARVRAAYGFHPRVLYPPVRTGFFKPDPAPSSGEDRATPYLIVSALTPYKRVDRAIRAANLLRKPLLVVGDGPNERPLRRLAGPTVQFVGWVDDATLRGLYRSCRALIFPGEEDFGLVPLEAMACGKPVLALSAGGLLETHQGGLTGEFFDQPDSNSLAEAWERFDPGAYDPLAIRRHAEAFSVERFQADFAERVADLLDRTRKKK